MKTKKFLLILIIAVLAVSASVALVVMLGRADYELVVDATDKVALTKEGFVIEADTSVSIPNGVVYDRSGNYCSDFTVKRTIVDETGAVKASTLQMKHGQVYTVTYVADNGVEQLEKVVKLKCYDTTIPTITFLNLQKTYNVDDEISIKVKDISSDVDYKASKIKLVNKKTKIETKLDLKKDYKFTAKKAEQYSLIVSLEDINDNKNEQVFNFRVTKQFKDKNISKNNIWDFDEKDYVNNVLLLGQSDDMEFDIVTKKMPKDKDKIGIEGGALNVSLKANESYDFKLINGNAVQVKKCANIGFNIWADEVIDIFEIYNVEDGSMVDLSWKVAKREKWQKVEFNPAEIFSEDIMVENLRIVMGCEEDVNVYIDSVYYTDYIEPWRDEDIPKDVIALFDDARYMERVLKLPGGDATTFGARWEYVTKIPGTTDFTGGAVKLVSTTDANQESGGSREGFQFQLFDRLAVSQMKGLLFRIYCEDPSAMISVSVIDKKMGTSPEIWASISGSTDNWVNILIDKEDLSSYWDGYENITHLNIRFIRPKGTQIKGKEEYVSYIDSISLYDLDYRKVAYKFKNEYDMRVVQGTGDAVPVKKADKNANDGWAAYTKTVLNMKKESGLLITFNNLDLSKYAHIYVRLRTSKDVGVYWNGKCVEWKHFKEYTQIDLLDYIEKAGTKVLNNIIIGRSGLADIEIYVDEIELITKEQARIDYSKVKYTFAEDYDMKVAEAVAGASIKNVKDSDANDGKVVKATTALDFQKPSGMKIAFNSLDLSQYAHIYMRLKTSKTIGIYWNDKCVEWKQFGEYTEIDLLDYADKAGATTLSNIILGVQSVEGVEIYVDEIVLITKEEAKIDYSKVKYTFAEDYDMKVVESVAGAKVKNAKDADAKDGKVVKSTTTLDFQKPSGMKIAFNSLDLSQYAHIYMRLKTSKTIGIYWNDKCVEWKQFSEYTEIDLLNYADKAEATTLSNIVLGVQSVDGVEIYVDEIILITKEEAKVDYSKVKYTFAEDYDMKAVESVAAGKISNVTDTDANDGKAVKTTTVLDFSKVSGMKISFDDLDTTKYAHIYLRLKSSGTISIFWNNKCIVWNQFGSYTQIDLLDYISIADTTILDNIILGAQSLGNVEIYVDEIVFVTKEEVEIDYSKVKYNFTDDYDMRVVESVLGAKVEKVEDSDAYESSAVKVVTGLDFSNSSGMKISFNNIDITKYAHIYMRLKTTKEVNIFINGQYADWKKFDGYKEVDIIAYAGKLGISNIESVTIGVKSLSGVEIYVDRITFEEKSNVETNYSVYEFNKNEDLSTVKAHNGGSFSLVDDSGANGGKALKVSTVFSSSVAGAQISFEHLDLSKYESIVVRYKSSDIAGIYVNGDKCFVWGGTQGAYTTKDLLTWSLAQGITHLDTLEIGLMSNAGKTTYIDEIIFVEKNEEDLTVTYGFNKDADLDIVKVHNGGAFTLVEDSGANDGKALKVSTVYSGSVAGAQISFDHIDLSKYESIIVRYKSSDIAGIYVNGDKCFVWGGTQGAYTTKDLLTWSLAQGITHLDTLEIGLMSNAGKTTYIDEIVFVKKGETQNPTAVYGFNKETDLSVVKIHNGGSFTLVEDSAANGGKALKVSTVYSSSVAGAQISFEHLELSKYESIIVRYKSSDIAGIYVNGNKCFVWGGTQGAYTTKDLLEWSLAQGITHLDTLEIGLMSNAGKTTYIDEIIFVEKK